jgi:hypothetical protein
MGEQPATKTVVLPADMALSRVLAPIGNRAGIRALLRHYGYSIVFDAPGAGRLAVSWYAQLREANGKRRVLLASLSARFNKPAPGY